MLALNSGTARKKRIFYCFGVLGVSLLAFTGGAYLQRNHAFLPLRRILQGRPLKVAPPQHSILHWELDARKNLAPRFSLEALELQTLQANLPVYRSTIEKLIRTEKFPSDFPSSSRHVERIELAKVVREKIELETEEKLWIPFYVFIPKEGKGPWPCILVLHGHSAGKIETAGEVPSYQRGNARALAEAGFVTVAPDFRGFGELGWSGEWEDPIGHEYGRSIHIQDVLYNLQVGRTTLGSFIYDLRKILDYLKGRPEVDPERIGVTGISMGVDVAIWLAVLEPEIKVVVAASVPLSHYPRPSVDYGSYHVCIDTIPGIRRFFRLQDIPLLVAPRPFLMDLYRPHLDYPAARSKLEELYLQAGSPEQLSISIHNEGDAFRNEKAIEWFKRWL